MRWHVRSAHLQYLRNLEIDLADADGGDDLSLEFVTDMEADKNDGISCELGIRYPTLQSIMAGKTRKNHLSLQVRHGTYHAI